MMSAVATILNRMPRRAGILADFMEVKGSAT